jgi:hypothetical protein
MEEQPPVANGHAVFLAHLAHLPSEGACKTGDQKHDLSRTFFNARLFGFCLHFKILSFVRFQTNLLYRQISGLSTGFPTKIRFWKIVYKWQQSKPLLEPAPEGATNQICVFESCCSFNISLLDNSIPLWYNYGV